MKEARGFSHKGEQMEMKARWAFVELPEKIHYFFTSGVEEVIVSEILPKTTTKVGVEFLSVEVVFNGRLEKCWNWHHEDHLEVLELIYSSAEGKISQEELLEELGGFDGNYSTTKNERKEVLLGLVEFNNHIQATAESLKLFPLWGK